MKNKFFLCLLAFAIFTFIQPATAQYKPKLKKAKPDYSSKIKSNKLDKNKIYKHKNDPAPVETPELYSISVHSLKCISEDDPGSEIEVFGKIDGFVFKEGTRNQSGRVWYLNVRDRVDIRPGDTYFIGDAYNFEELPSVMASGDIEIDILIDLYEHDGSSQNEEFYRRDSWKLSRGDSLGEIMTLRMRNQGTVLELKWSVRKVELE